MPSCGLRFGMGGAPAQRPGSSDRPVVYTGKSAEAPLLIVPYGAPGREVSDRPTLSPSHPHLRAFVPEPTEHRRSAALRLLLHAAQGPLHFPEAGGQLRIGMGPEGQNTPVVLGGLSIVAPLLFQLGQPEELVGKHRPE